MEVALRYYRLRGLRETFITCEVHPLYCEMIESRLKQDGAIEFEYRNKLQQSRLLRRVDIEGF